MDRKRGYIKIKEKVKIFSSLIYRGKIRAAVRHVCEREIGGISIPGSIDEKIGEIVYGKLKLKHLEGGDVAAEDLPLSDTYPELIEIEVTDENVELVTKKLSDLAGPSGIDAISISHWLLKFGGPSKNYRRA